MNDYAQYDPIDVIATYAHGIGPKWSLIFNKTDPNDFQKPSKIVEEAHKNGLYVHGYSFQEDLLNLVQNPIEELELWVKKGVDGVFTEFVQPTYDWFKF